MQDQYGSMGAGALDEKIQAKAAKVNQLFTEIEKNVVGQRRMVSRLLIGLFSLGWAFMVPVVTIMVLDLYPERRGMASSLQSAIASAANAVVAGALVPLVMHSLQGLALMSAGFLAIGLLAWARVRRSLQTPPSAPTAG